MWSISSSCVPLCTVVLYRCVPLCTAVYRCVPLCSVVYRCVPLYCTVVYRCTVPLWTVVYRCVPLCTAVYRCVPLCTVVFRCVPLCTVVYRCTLPTNARCTCEIKHRTCMPKAVLKKNATVFTNKLNINLRRNWRNAAAQLCVLQKLGNFGTHRNYPERFETWCWRSVKFIRTDL
jgi:hypothetical protein